MELLPEGHKNTTEVSWLDQKKINEFLALINKKDLLAEELQRLTTEKEYMDDLSLEVELVDSDTIPYKIGDTFISLSTEKAVEAIERDTAVVAGKIDALELRIAALDETLAALKTHLYAKFGTNIHLER